jgi:hypothetical protein
MKGIVLVKIQAFILRFAHLKLPELDQLVPNSLALELDHTYQSFINEILLDGDVDHFTVLFEQLPQFVDLR